MRGWRTWLTGAYLCGAALFSGWLLLGIIALVRVVRTAALPSKEIQGLWNRLITEKECRAKLLVSPVAIQPMTFGLLQPIVVIPNAFCRPELRHRLWFVLQHELVHVERRDALSWMLANAARSALYHQPLFWWIRRQLRLSQEYIADSLAAHGSQSAADYACVLVDIAAELNGRRALAWQGVGIFSSRSELYRRIEKLARAESVSAKWSGVGVNIQSGLCAAVAVTLLSLLTLQAGGQANEPNAQEANPSVSANGATDDSSSRNWYILRQPNTMGLFHGLPQRMEAFSTATTRTGYTWDDMVDGSSLRLELDVESKEKGEVFVGFFEDPRWWVAPPVQVRRFTGPGEYNVNDLPPGTYYIGAIIGSLPRPVALGVERTWPQGIVVQTGKRAAAHVLVSDEFQWFSNTENPRNFVGDWPKLDPSRLVTVRTIGSKGEPIPYCHIWYSITSGSHAASFGTDHRGYTYRDDIEGTFSVTATEHSFDPATLADRYHSKRLTELHDAVDRPVIQVVMEPFPSGTGTVAGQVHDQFARPLKEFHVSISQGDNGPNMSGQRIPFIDSEGRFEIKELAPGEYTIRASAFDYQTHVYQRGDDIGKFTIRETPNDVTLVDVALEARELRYGRAVFENGDPVTRGVWSGPPGAHRIKPDGTFRVGMSHEELDRLTALEHGKVRVKAYGKSGENVIAGAEVSVAWNDLSKDPAQPLIVVLPRPDLPTESVETRVAKEVDDPDAILRLKQLGAYVKTRDDGSVEEISFLDARMSDSDVILLQEVPNIEQLKFERTEVSDAMLKHVKELPNLRELGLHDADVTDLGIEQLRGMPTLRVLNVSSTGITDTGLEALATLSQLEVLDLTSTKVTDTGMQHVALLSNLSKLTLAWTRVTDDGLAHIGKLENLEELSLSALPITDSGLRHIAGLTSLKVLSLSQSRITDAGLEHLAGMKDLKSLTLSDTRITDKGVDDIAKFSQLERLHLSDTRVTDASLEKLAPLSNLRVLYIDPNITDAALSHLSAFPHLEVLSVGGPAITDKGVEQIAKLSDLTNLFLDGSNITDASVPHLVRMRKLYFLTLRETKITPAGIQVLWDSSRAHPPQIWGPK